MGHSVQGVIVGGRHGALRRALSVFSSEVTCPGEQWAVKLALLVSYRPPKLVQLRSFGLGFGAPLFRVLGPAF
jgi:hypothetical protein